MCAIVSCPWAVSWLDHMTHLLSGGKEEEGWASALVDLAAGTEALDLKLLNLERLDMVGSECDVVQQA